MRRSPRSTAPRHSSMTPHQPQKGFVGSFIRIRLGLKSRTWHPWASCTLQRPRPGRSSALWKRPQCCQRPHGQCRPSPRGLALSRALEAPLWLHTKHNVSWSPSGPERRSHLSRKRVSPAVTQAISDSEGRRLPGPGPPRVTRAGPAPGLIPLPPVRSRQQRTTPLP